MIALTVALLFGGPWFVRNAQVYGHLDLLAWQRHDAVVSGQPRTSQLLSQVGPASLVSDWVQTTFRSFWAQFGWMGVLVDQRIYMGLALLSVLLISGFVLWLFQLRTATTHLPVRRDGGRPASAQRIRTRELEIVPPSEPEALGITTEQTGALAILALAGLLTILLYVAYNLKFVQHQGRYLFPALGTFSLAAALGLRELLRPRTARAAAAVLLLTSLLLVTWGAVSKDMPVWPLVLLLAGCAWSAAAAWLPRRWAWIVPAFLYGALLLLDAICLFAFVLPALTL